MTQVSVIRRTTGSGRAERTRPPVRDLLRSGWNPAGFVVTLTVAVLHHYAVSFQEMAAFGAFTVLAVTVPGTLIWRALRGGARFAAEDMAAGTALGHALTVLAYIPARWAGQPLLVLAWPITTITIFLVAPALRPFWRGAPRRSRTPLAFSWALAAFAGSTVLSSGTAFFRYQGLTWPGYSTPYVDMPFHLALVGELKHHMPPTSPFVLGEPLHYHWFVYADMAATSWATGIEPQTLLYRLFLLPVLAASTILIAAIARRLTGRWWPGVVALALTMFALGPNPCAWAPALGAGALMRPDVPWFSPTQTFAAMLFAPLVLLLVGLLRQRRPGVGPWALLSILLAVLMGSKSVFLPILLAGLLVVLVVTMIREHRLHRAAAVALSTAVPCLVFAQAIIFGGASDGLVIHPLSLFGTIASKVGSTLEPTLELKCVAVLVGAFGLVCVWMGVIVLGFRPKTLLDPPVRLLTGIGAAGMAAGLITRFPGGSERYFIYGASPYLCVAAVQGMVAVLPERNTRRSRAMLAGALGGGIVLILMIRALSGGRPEAAQVAQRIMVPFASLMLLTVTFAVLLILAAHRNQALRSLSPALAVAFAIGLVIPPSLVDVGQVWRGTSHVEPLTLVSRGTLEAGRWLRDHSHPGDVVATNAICHALHVTGCVGDPFSVSAYTERRVLVESWIYVMRTHEEALRRHIPEPQVPYWDPQRLADNNAVFQHPSRAAVRRLRDRYGVRWLFADLRHDPPATGLRRFARFRYEAGDWAVYQIPG